MSENGLSIACNLHKLTNIVHFRRKEITYTICLMYCFNERLVTLLQGRFSRNVILYTTRKGQFVYTKLWLFIEGNVK